MDASDFGLPKFDSVEEKHDWIGLGVRKDDLISCKLVQSFSMELAAMAATLARRRRKRTRLQREVTDQ